MSYKATAAVWENSRCAGTDFIILLAIADVADHCGVAWPSVGWLSLRAKVSDRQIRYSFGKLERAGELAIYPEKSIAGTHLYRITLPGIEPIEDSTHFRDAVRRNRGTIHPRSPGQEVGAEAHFRPGSPLPVGGGSPLPPIRS